MTWNFKKKVAEDSFQETQRACSYLALYIVQNVADLMKW